MSKEQDLLKSLLLKEELELLDKISHKVLSKDQFTHEVSNVLASAVIRAQEKNGQFQRALSKPVKIGVEKAFSENKQSIIDSLLPIMGQLIRKTVTNSIKQFVTDINQAIELGLSSKAIKWRWQAFKTGRAFAEIVFQNTIRYQVEECFLVNRHNGLLIEHVGIDDLLKDNNAISAMLTIIQDFIGDSLQSSASSSLTSVVINNKVVTITTGPTAFLATVIKGSPTEKFNERSQKLIENIHADFSDHLSDENSSQDILGLADYLRPHLVIKTVTESNKKTNWWPWIIAMILIISMVSYWVYSRKQQFNDVVKTAHAIDGLSVQSITRNYSGFQIQGLVDPLADISSLNRNDITLTTKPFISLDPEIIDKRVNNITEKYNGIKAHIDNQTVNLSGSITPKNYEKLFLQINNVYGVSKINDLLKINYFEEIQSHINKVRSAIPNINYQINDNNLILTGTSDYDSYTLFNAQITTLFPDVSVDDSNLNIDDSTENLINVVNNTTIYIDNTDGINNGISNINELSNLIKSLQSLKARSIRIPIKIIGHSDCNGKLSDQFSKSRTEIVKRSLIEKGVDNSLLSTEIIQCENFVNIKQSSELKVTFITQQQ